ncbi:MAG: DUF1003 domain-containing protein [Bdellovibrionota bacterium]
MSTSKQAKIECPVCHKEKLPMEIFAGRSVRAAVQEFIKAYAPEWSPDQNVCGECLHKARSDFVESTLLQEKKELTGAEKQVIDAIRNQEIISTDPSDEDNSALKKFGDRVSDRFAEVGGSWTFIISFVGLLILWIAFNSWALFQKPFDPYPFILLNLVLSCVAALQAPVIMMSQNRQESKDRKHAEADYKTNLKAELEIRHLHIKIDQLISHQWQKLLEIQHVQLDMMKDSLERPKK